MCFVNILKNKYIRRFLFAENKNKIPILSIPYIHLNEQLHYKIIHTIIDTWYTLHAGLVSYTRGQYLIQQECTLKYTPLQLTLSATYAETFLHKISWNAVHYCPHHGCPQHDLLQYMQNKMYISGIEVRTIEPCTIFKHSVPLGLLHKIYLFFTPRDFIPDSKIYITLLFSRAPPGSVDIDKVIYWHPQDIPINNHNSYPVYDKSLHQPFWGYTCNDSCTCKYSQLTPEQSLEAFSLSMIQ